MSRGPTLRPRVRDHLRANPGGWYTVGEVKRALGAPSPDAVRQALDKLAELGEAGLEWPGGGVK